ncbi:hypothetical protein [Nocardia pseudovaccinii]|uniref:hypothetical protein n=1 Tax=Nocardia pseudovaccinii TaxID=189540 RepID=UPI0007A44AAC|nr:hypothetical protein [Nocardia pseudovaccinii]
MYSHSPGAAPTLATAVNFSAFDVGITVGPWLGGLAIGGGLGYPSVAWIGMALAITTLATVTWAAALHRRARQVQKVSPVDRDMVELTV